jgi:pimeloyl-ACP methyl ester carboxylesterase
MVAPAAWRGLYPFASNWLQLGPGGDSPSVRYHYLDEGPQDAPPVVMLHGNPTWSFYYRTLVPGLSQAYRVVVPDHVGCGLSDKPQDDGLGRPPRCPRGVLRPRQPYYTLDQHIANLEQLVDHLGLKRLTLVVHDWGGPIGMGYAVRHPSNVARLVVLNTAAFYEGTLPLRIQICRIPGFGDLVVRGLNAFARLALVWAVYQRERLTPQIRAGYLAPYDCWDNRVAILRFVQDIPLEPGHRSRGRLSQIEANLYLLEQHPMLLLWGAKDFCFTPHSFLIEWQQRFPYAETRVIEDAGHYVVEDAHEHILPWLLEFMETPGP